MIVSVLALLFCLPGVTALGDRGKKERGKAAQSREKSGQRQEKKISVGSKTGGRTDRGGNRSDGRRTPPGRKGEDRSDSGRRDGVKHERRDPRIDRRRPVVPDRESRRDPIRPRWERPHYRPKPPEKKYKPAPQPEQCCDYDIVPIEEPVVVYVEPCEPPWIPTEPYAIPLPFDIIYPDDIDRDFYIMINEHYNKGEGHYQLVCLIQMVHPDDRSVLHELARDWYIEDMVIYKALTSYTYLVRLPVDMIYHLFYNSRVRWIGEYKSEYKCAHHYWEGFDGETVIASLEGDRLAFREDLEAMGLEVVRFVDSQQVYYVKADWYDFPEIAQLWWIASVYQKSYRPIRTYELLRRASLD
jgi:hypothetical protein